MQVRSCRDTCRHTTRRRRTRARTPRAEEACVSDDGQHRNPARGLGALARSPPGEADLISSGPTHLPAPVASTQASYSLARLVVEAYTSIDGSIHPSGSGTATLRALRPHLLDRYGCTPPLPGPRPRRPAPLPIASCRCRVRAREGCGRWAPAHGVRPRSPRVTSLSPPHPTPGPPPRPLHPIMADPSVQRTRLPPSSHPPWLQNRTLCMHAALSQLPTRARPAGSTLRPRASPSLSHEVVAVAGIPLAGRGLLRHRFCPSRRARACIHYLLVFIFCPDNDRSTTSGRVRGPDARIDAPTSAAVPASFPRFSPLMRT